LEAAGALKVLDRPVGQEERLKMQVKQILREKGSDVISIASDATLSEAARLLARKRIGAVIVRDEKGDLAGILSERDVVHAVATDSVSALCRPVGVYMTRAVATCGDCDTVDELMEMMTHGRFRHVPVLDESDQLIGIVSIGDVVKTRIEETVREAASLREYIAAAG
jgi:CBS domain-containing protein